MALNPISAIFDSKYYHISPLLTRGAVFNFVGAWYRAGCPELPPDIDYQQTCGIRATDWPRHKKWFLMIMDDIMPILQKDAKRKGMKKLINQENAKKARAGNVAKKQLKKHAKKIEQMMLSDSHDDHTPIAPISPPPRPFKEGFSQHSTVKKERTPGEQSTSFTD